ncbi:helix-turn-helix domain-containing protein [Pseudomonas gessardii]|uniref:Helix-turn-helix domain-containing protein n=2 Tax=Pseudomonas gessardii TaxID=78544 RepID=A0ABS9F8Y1_9PSED|nr:MULTISPECIES: S24 family peptidase [Pseudomonas]MCF4990822.1 helix-turn-helix domain-containing protein [Pseudomonas gessardii]MCF5085691.1 helix-turn-helix domain-containing protein [Pseudomonas gessardii]MCF5098677.1 helix-turn-helix domain-containing protein [Pseudomonas gessardii]MCF5108810.1 helix-turn-helix domain-containing protein [Pseudomonas gessardii]OEC70075.1 peptidase S24 [Pseudomonas sp. AP19]
MIGDRIAQRMNEMNLSEGELGRRSGVPQPTIHRIVTNAVVSPRHQNVEKIAKALKVSSNWLWKGGDQSDQGAKHINGGAVAENNVEPGPTIKGYVPLISWVQAGAWCEVTDVKTLDDAEVWLPCAASHSNQSYALRVRGLSMFNQHERRSFRDGDIIFVDPAKDAENGSLVIAKLVDSQEATFKQLVMEGSRRFLKPLNPAWPEPIIELGTDATICGVVFSKLEIF